MASPELLDVDPCTLHLPPSRDTCEREVAMIDPTRQEILQLLAELSEVVPEVRLGQLMVNLSYLARGLTKEAIYDMEDEELLETCVSIWNTGSQNARWKWLSGNARGDLPHDLALEEQTKRIAAEQRFSNLAAAWKSETELASKVAKKVMHAAYQKNHRHG